MPVGSPSLSSLSTVRIGTRGTTIRESGGDAPTVNNSMPPLTIRKPETLVNRLEKMEAEAVQQATETNQRATVTVRINGAEVQAAVTPAVNPGRLYRLFYVNGKRVARTRLIDDRMLLAAAN